MERMFKKVALSIIIWIVGSSLTILLYFAMLLAVILVPFDKKRRLAHAQCFWWSDALIALNPYWDIEVTGLENIDKKRTYVIIANHQSLADIVIAYQTRMQFKWVAKASLFKVPFIGWSLGLAKHIRLSRGNFSSIKKVYRQAASWLKEGMSVLFFPEGTRSANDEMGQFQNGAFKLAIKEKVPILPVAIEGTGEAIPKGSWLFETRIPGKLKILAPIETAGFAPADFELLRDLARERLENA